MQNWTRWWPQGLTLDDFKRLAARKPNIEGKWVYRLLRYVTWEQYQPYPYFDMHKMNEEYFLSLAEADAEIQNFKNYFADENYCFIIEQLAIGRDELEPKVGWLYDDEGNLLDYTIARPSEDPYTRFFYGRPAERNRFKPGDIVEVMSPYHGVHLALYLKNPPSPEECYDTYSQHGTIKPVLDAKTDCAQVVSKWHGQGDYSMESPLHILKPRYPIPPELEAEMKSWLTDEGKLTKRGRPKRKYCTHGYPIDDFYNLKLRMDYDEKLEQPHLHVVDEYGLDARLCIDRAEYYAESDGKPSSVLTDVQKEALMDYLQIEEYARTKWWYLIRKFNEYHCDDLIYIDPTTPLPNYRKLK